MIVINNFNDYSINTPTVVTIGTFDGVHLGHQKIIRSIVRKAKENNEKSIIVTFFPHPRIVLETNSALKLINTIEERIKLIEELGIDYFVIIPFDVNFSNLSAHEFIESVLVKKLNTKNLYIGYDHQFGKHREGNFELLQQEGAKHHFTVHEISAISLKEVTISSTKIRNSIAAGNIEQANSYLGYNFFLTGTVVEGLKIGSQLGFPTANIELKESYKLIPKNGVYVVQSMFEERVIYGMMNIGYRPTVDGKNQTIEVHFFNFNQYIYRADLKIEILIRLRDEQKFDTLDALKNQLFIDQKNAQLYIKSIQK